MFCSRFKQSKVLLSRLNNRMASFTAPLRLGDVAPDFTQETTVGMQLQLLVL